MIKNYNFFFGNIKKIIEPLGSFGIVFCWIYSGHIPTNFPFWFSTVISSTIAVFCGEYVCMKIEMKPIIMSKNKINKKEDYELQTIYHE